MVSLRLEREQRFLLCSNISGHTRYGTLAKPFARSYLVDKETHTSLCTQRQYTSIPSLFSLLDVWDNRECRGLGGYSAGSPRLADIFRAFAEDRKYAGPNFVAGVDFIMVSRRVVVDGHLANQSSRRPSSYDATKENAFILFCFRNSALSTARLPCPEAERGRNRKRERSTCLCPFC